MASRPRSGLLAWAFASFHVALLVAVAIWLVHLGGGLGDLLSGLDTLLGLGLYGVLWAIVWRTTDPALTAAPPATSSAGSLLRSGATYGAATGVAFLLLLVVPGGLLLLLQGGELVPVVFVGGVGAVVATVVGALLGCAFALLDAGLVRAGRHLAGRR